MAAFSVECKAKSNNSRVMKFGSSIKSISSGPKSGFLKDKVDPNQDFER